MAQRGNSGTRPVLTLTYMPGAGRTDERRPASVKLADVLEMAQAGRAANAAGLIISWDLMHAPMDGVEALAEAMKA